MEKKKRFKMPHAYVIIFIMTVITAILANIIPAGTFDRVEDASGNSVVVADSFHHVDKIGCSIFVCSNLSRLDLKTVHRLFSLSSLHMHLYMYF